MIRAVLPATVGGLIVLLAVFGANRTLTRANVPDDTGAGAAVESEELALRITSPRRAYRRGEAVPLRVQIINRGVRPVTLVEPGDGSHSGWRTPLVGWSVLGEEPEGRIAKHPLKVPLYRGGRCGNTNPLTAKEVFALRPGESRDLQSWVGQPEFTTPGTYRVVCYYENRPSIKWAGLPLGVNDDAAMKRVRKSFPCLLRSNELVITIAAAK